MKPLLAHIYEPHRVTFPCYVQPKLNGIRALYQNGCFQSRDEVPFPSGLLDHLAKPLLEVFDPSVILDGELYVHGWPLQRINAAVTPVRLQPTEDTLQVEYHVFDKVDYIKSFEQRCIYGTHWGEYFEFVQQRKTINFVATVKVTQQSQADEFYAKWVIKGYEGMMYRLGACPYTVPKQENTYQFPTAHKQPLGRTRFLSDKDNRCWHLLKRKDWQDHEFECLGMEEGEGKLLGTCGALICATVPTDKTSKVQHQPRFNVGSGLTDAQRAFYWSNPPIGKLIKVKYLCLSSDSIPLNPTIHPDHIVQ